MSPVPQSLSPNNVPPTHSEQVDLIVEVVVCQCECWVSLPQPNLRSLVQSDLNQEKL